MPSSYYENIPKIIDMLLFINPKSILDVGAGFGKYGVLIREYLDECDPDKRRRLDCVEVFQKYITPLHHYIYDSVLTKDIKTVCPANYDLILLIDIFEHIEKEEGKILFKKLIESNKGILFSIPKHIDTDDVKQPESFGNKYEAHLSIWTEKEMVKLAQSFGCYTAVYPDPLSTLIYVGKENNSLQEKIDSKRFKNLLKNIPGVLTIKGMVGK